MAKKKTEIIIGNSTAKMSGGKTAAEWQTIWAAKAAAAQETEKIREKISELWQEVSVHSEDTALTDAQVDFWQRLDGVLFRAGLAIENKDWTRPLI